MARNLKPICTMVIALAAAALLFATPPQAEAWDTDTMPVWSPEHVLTAIPGGGAAGSMLAAGAPACLQCRCCSSSEPSNCQITNCCSTFNCDAAGKCNVVQQNCGCNGC